MAASIPARRPARLLVIPGLHDSGPAHWQSWLQSLYRYSLRVVQDDWSAPDLERWSTRIADTLERAGPGPWIAVAHSFGCLALARCLARQPRPAIHAALLVAPADPARFELADRLPRQALPVPSAVIASETDPWMSAAEARRWARHWGSACASLGDAGHINTESGFGPLPLARYWVTAMGQRLERQQRLERSSVAEWAFAV